MIEIKRRQTSENVSIGCWTTNQLDIKGEGGQGHSSVSRETSGVFENKLKPVEKDDKQKEK